MPRHALLALLLGCAAPTPPPAGPARVAVERGTAEGRAHTLCPLQVPRAAVRMEPTDQGPELTFLAPEPHREEVQQQVRLVASALGEAGSALLWRRDTEVEVHSMPWPRPVVELAPGGARLTLRPTDPAHLEALTFQVAAWARHLQQGGCVVLEVVPPSLETS